jgi:superoxide dismutase, Fe-Mn family
MKQPGLSAKTFQDAIFSMDGISKKTVEEHLKLYQGYVTKYNEINTKLGALTDEDYSKANQVYSTIRELKVELSFAWGGVVNHEIYFGHLGGKGGTPEGDLSSQLIQDFGSFDNYIKDLKASSIAARGWVWTAWNEREKRLFNYVGDSQNTYLTWETRPILALDTYEHAYFIDYGVNRGQYIDAFLKNVDWSIVSNNLMQAKA